MKASLPSLEFVPLRRPAGHGQFGRNFVLIAVIGLLGILVFGADLLAQQESPEFADQPANNYIDSVLFLPDGKTIVTGHMNGTITLWDVATGKITKTLKGRNPFVTHLAVSPDGKTLAGRIEDASIRNPLKTELGLWDVETGKPQVLADYKEAVPSLAFSHDSKTLATASHDQTIRLWDVASGQQQKVLAKDVSPGNLAFLPDDKTLVTGHSDHVSLRDVESGTVIREFKFPRLQLHQLAVSPDGETLVVAVGPVDPRRVERRPDLGLPGKLVAYDVKSGKRLREVRLKYAQVTHIRFSPDGKLLAVAPLELLVYVLDAKTLKRHATLENFIREEEGPGRVQNNGSSAGVVAFSPDGAMLVSRVLDRIKLWNLKAGKPIGKPRYLPPIKQRIEGKDKP